MSKLGEWNISSGIFPEIGIFPLLSQKVQGNEIPIVVTKPPS